MNWPRTVEDSYEEARSAWERRWDYGEEDDYEDYLPMGGRSRLLDELGEEEM